MIRRLMEGIAIGVASSFISKGLDKYGGIEMIKSIYQTFVVELWPIWVGLIVAIIYWIVRLLIDVYKIENTYRSSLDDMTKKIQRNTDKTMEAINQVYEEISEWREASEAVMKKCHELEGSVNELNKREQSVSTG